MSLSEAMGELSGVMKVLSNLQQIRDELNFVGVVVIVFTMIPFLLNCFFGYKIKKVMITIGGVIKGAIIGAILGVILAASTDIPVGATVGIAAILIAILGGFLAFKLYKFGIFMLYWFLGTLVFLVVFIVMGMFEMSFIAIIPGLVVGILAVVLNKPYLIITTAIAGGMGAGYLIGILTNTVVGFLLGIALSVGGAIVQFHLEKKAKPAAAAPGAVPYVNGAVSGATPVVAAAALVAPEAAPMPVAPAPAPVPAEPETQISTIVPTYFCPQSRILIDKIVLSKNSIDEVFADIYFRNISDKEIIALDYVLSEYNIAGEHLADTDKNLLDIHIAPSSVFRTGNIKLSNNTARQIKVLIIQTVDSEYAVGKFTKEDTIDIPKQALIADLVDPDIYKLLDLKDDEKYLYSEVKDGAWLCTCGHIAVNRCSFCNRGLEDQFSNTEEYINKRIDTHIDNLASEIENCKQIKTLDTLKEKANETVSIVSQKTTNEELINKSKSLIEKISVKEIELKNTKAKNKKRGIKAIIIVAMVALALLVGFIVYRVVRGLPPADKTIEEEIKTYINNTFDSFNAEGIIQKGEKVKQDNLLTSSYDVVAVNENNDDRMETDVRVEYAKINGKYELSKITNGDYIVYPDHKISDKDELPFPSLTLTGDEEIFVDADNHDLYISSGYFKDTISYNYDEAVVNGLQLTIPARIDIGHNYAGTEEILMLEYSYMGDYKWEALGKSSLSLERRNEKLDAETVKNSADLINISYNGENLAGQYMTLEVNNTEYRNGYKDATADCGFVWDNGIAKCEGTINLEFYYYDNKWIYSSSGNSVVSGLTYLTNEVDDATLIDMLKVAIESHCSEKTAVDNISIIDKSYSDGLNVIAEYTSEKGVFGIKNTINVNFADAINTRYGDSKLLSETVTEIAMKEEVDTDVPTSFRLVTKEDYPNGVPASGNTTLHVRTKSDLSISITGKVGNITLILSGDYSYPDGSITYEPVEMDINTHYTMLFSYNSDIVYKAKPNLTYDFETGTLSGEILFDSVAFGVDNFTVVFGG